MSWQVGRELAGVTLNDNTSISYTYNTNDMRTQRTDNGDTTYYYYDSDKNLIGLTKGNYTLLFYYDSDGNVTSFKYNGTMYYYIKNLQGDVVKIINQSGTECVSYVYDAWGNNKSASGNPILRELNPFRYRSYVYDEETGLYYLQSRYYDPFTGRFLNADDTAFIGATGTVISTNLFVYCHNSPINLSDPTGFQPKWAQVISRYAKGTLVYKAFLLATQKGWFSNLFWISGFFRTADGIYHARQDCWQQFFGYNDFYDWAFGLGTSMARAKFPFYSGSKEYIFWAWKGDYFNLGAGAELGIYSKIVINGKSVGHWVSETKTALPTTMTLKLNKKVIANYKPSAKQWWITCFNPYYQNVNASRLSVTFTINFSSNKKLFNDFYNKYGTGKYKSKLWKFDKKNYKATFTF